MFCQSRNVPDRHNENQQAGRARLAIGKKAAPGCPHSANAAAAECVGMRKVKMARAIDR